MNLQTTGKAAASSLPLLPVQLIESAGNFLLGVILLLLFRRIRRSGMIAVCYFFGYAVLRFVLEFFRGDHTDRILGMTRAQLTGLFVMIPVGIFCYFYFQKHGEDVNTDSAV